MSQTSANEWNSATKWNGSKRMFPAFQRTIRSELASKKILWTIQDDVPKLLKPRASMIKIASRDGNPTDADFRAVEKYDKQVKARREECE